MASPRVESLKENLYVLGGFVGLILFYLAVLGVSQLLSNWGSTDPNDPFATTKMTTFHYYVEAIDEDSNSDAVYTLPADVKSNSNSVPCESDYGCDSGVNVTKIHWPNGGYTTFTSCSMVNFNFDDYIGCTATNGDHRDYGIKLTNKKV